MVLSNERVCSSAVFQGLGVIQGYLSPCCQGMQLLGPQLAGWDLLSVVSGCKCISVSVQVACQSLPAHALTRRVKVSSRWSSAMQQLK